MPLMRDVLIAVPRFTCLKAAGAALANQLRKSSCFIITGPVLPRNVRIILVGQAPSIHSGSSL